MNIQTPIQPRKGNWIQTANGRQVWPVDPRPEDISILDIASSLSRICRYNGHLDDSRWPNSIYSVAQHSVLVCRALPREFRLWGLLHDASEAYLADVPKPVKPSLANYYELEDQFMATVVDAFGLVPLEMPEEVKRVDNAILADEMRDIMVPPPVQWDLPEAPLGIKIEPWSVAVARDAFLAEYLRLTREVA